MDIQGQITSQHNGWYSNKSDAKNTNNKNNNIITTMNIDKGGYI